MNDSFDPYHKWLGIPPEDQPPHHYRLLGVEPFESDADVIAIAADGRMAQLKHFQTGKYSDLSQKLLNEIATARICLLNPEKREKYDDTLRQRLEEAKKPAVKAAPAGRKPAAQTTAGEPATGGTAAPQIDLAGVSSYLSRHSQKRRNRWLLPAAAGVVAVGLIVVLVIAFSGAENGQTDTPGGPVADGLTNSLSRKGGSKPHDPIPPTSPPYVVPPEDLSNGPPIDPDTVASTAEPGRSLADLIDPMGPVEPLPSDGEHSEVPEEDGPDDPPMAERLPVPDAAAKKEAEGKIRAAFKSELAAAKTPKLKLKLAESLLAESRDPTNKPGVRFMLIQIGCQMAAEAGGLAESLTAADELAKQYELDGKQIRSHVFKTVRASLAAVGRDLNAVQSIIDVAMQQADAALTGDDLDAAGDAMRLALTAAKVTKDKYVLRQVNTRVGEITALTNVFRKVKPALETLAEKPDDAEANWEVGRWRCFCTGAWETGLPLLAKGSDDKVAELAKLDVAGPEDVKDQMRLADEWFALAKNESKYAKAELYLRAEHWYQRAFPNLAAIEKRNVGNRLKEIAKALQSAGPQVGGSVQEGNVSLATNGTTVSGKNIRSPEGLFDGISNQRSTDDGGHSTELWPCEWIVTFREAYRLRELRFRLRDEDAHYSQYTIATSADGVKYTDLVDRSEGRWTGWQKITFSPRAVKAVKLRGLHVGNSKWFLVFEFEAYCIPPRKPRG